MLLILMTKVHKCYNLAAMVEKQREVARSSSCFSVDAPVPRVNKCQYHFSRPEDVLFSKRESRMLLFVDHK